jgi:hypothetical protein
MFASLLLGRFRRAYTQNFSRAAPFDADSNGIFAFPRHKALATPSS